VLSLVRSEAIAFDRHAPPRIPCKRRMQHVCEQIGCTSIGKSARPPCLCVEAISTIGLDSVLSGSDQGIKGSSMPPQTTFARVITSTDLFFFVVELGKRVHPISHRTLLKITSRTPSRRFPWHKKCTQWLLCTKSSKPRLALLRRTDTILSTRLHLAPRPPKTNKIPQATFLL